MEYVTPEGHPAHPHYLRVADLCESRELPLRGHSKGALGQHRPQYSHCNERDPGSAVGHPFAYETGQEDGAHDADGEVGPAVWRDREPALPCPKTLQGIINRLSHIIRRNIPVHPETARCGVSPHRRPMTSGRQDGDGGVLHCVISAYPIYQSVLCHMPILTGAPVTCAAQIHHLMGRSVCRTASGFVMAQPCRGLDTCFAGMTRCRRVPIFIAMTGVEIWAIQAGAPNSLRPLEWRYCPAM